MGRVASVGRQLDDRVVLVHHAARAARHRAAGTPRSSSAQRSSSGSRPGTTHAAGTPPSACSAPSSTSTSGDSASDNPFTRPPTERHDHHTIRVRENRVRLPNQYACLMLDRQRRSRQSCSGLAGPPTHRATQPPVLVPSGRPMEVPGKGTTLGLPNAAAMLADTLALARKPFGSTLRRAPPRSGHHSRIAATRRRRSHSGRGCAHRGMTGRRSGRADRGMAEGPPRASLLFWLSCRWFWLWRR